MLVKLFGLHAAQCGPVRAARPVRRHRLRRVLGLWRAGIYSQIAVALKGGAWRKTSMALLVKTLGMSKEEVESAKEGHDVLGLGSEVSQLLRASLARVSKAQRSLAYAAGSSRNVLRRLQHPAGGSSSAWVTSTASSSVELTVQRLSVPPIVTE
jgi:hypothetical protein